MVWANKKYYSIYFRYIFGARRTIEYNIYEPPNVFYAFISLVFYTLYIYKICMYVIFDEAIFARNTIYRVYPIQPLYIVPEDIYFSFFVWFVEQADFCFVVYIFF